MKTMTKEEFKILYNEDTYEVVHESPHKHDISLVNFVYQDKDSKWYRGYFYRSYNDGIDWYNFPINLEEVEKIEVKTFEWRKVKNEEVASGSQPPKKAG